MSLALAKKILFSLRKTVIKTRANDSRDLLKKLNSQKEKILSGIPISPIARNSVYFVFNDIKIQNINLLKTDLLNKINKSLAHVLDSQDNLASLATEKIKHGFIVYVHGYSESVMASLIKTKQRGINFEVHCTEGIKQEGRVIAKELAKFKIPVKYFADMALRQSLKRADVILAGAKLIAENGQIYGKIGSELVAEMAEKYEVPVYICTDSWKCNPFVAREYEKTSLRPQKELWSNPPKNVAVLNYGFEKINPRLITGVITESGIYKPLHLISELKENNPWLF